ncbi:acetyltransferase (GNAT) family protein [Kineococcus xinjiangensis]|uniref:Acetyltransferase (GNAT) family protein n=1 Tax=Kineococcus xinjiangensis TaxID=512762 RepID=A0A2S6IX06_9ACTN|nr:GNAT family N-acetyltransferase [Kineococcus xinjiangensis]PPK98815.1 acetyltransferase (GNAT) family protein [Kineococcus xinjiangensis]
MGTAGGARHEVREEELRPGARVVVRHLLNDGSASDALGELLAADAQTLVVATRRGTVRVARSAVLAAKAVPPPPQRPERPHRAVGVADLERVMAAHWRAAQEEPLGDWLLRAAGGFTSRANSCLALGSPGVDLPAALAGVRAFYAARGLPAVVAVPHEVDSPDAPHDGPAGELDAALAGAGWGLRTPTLVLTAATRRLPRPHPAPPGLALELSPTPDEGWLGAYRYRGTPLPAAGRALLESAQAQVFVSVRRGAEVVALARGSLSPGWVGLTAVEVSEEHRRRGLGRLLLAAVAGWGLERGAASTYLQVAQDNAAARALYASAGFTVHHGYRYRVAP